MSDGVFTSAAFVNGVATEAATTRTDIAALVGDALVSENHRFPQLKADGVGFRLENRSDHVTKFWPRAGVAYDELPLSDSTPIAGTTAGEFWQREVHRRRRILAKSGVAYVVRGFGDPAPTQEDLGAARRFVAEFKEAPPAEPENPLKRTTYERASTAMLGDFDEQTGIGIVRKIE